MSKGKFVFPETDEVFETKPFVQIGKPYEWQPKEKPEPKKLTKWQKARAWFKFFTFQWESDQIEQTETKPSEDEDTREEQDRIEYPEEPNYPDSTDSDLIEFELDTEASRI